MPPALSSEEFHRRVAHLCCRKFDELPKTGKPQQREWTVLAGIVQCAVNGDIVDSSGCIDSTSLQRSEPGSELNSPMRNTFTSPCDSASAGVGEQSCGDSSFGSKNTSQSSDMSAVMAKDPNELDLSVVALGSGTKCLGNSEWCPRGSRVHDSHAEVVAKRAFQRYLMGQTAAAFSGKPSVFEARPTAGTSTCAVKLRLKKGISYHLFVSTTPCGDASIFPQNTADDDSVPSVVDDVQNLALSERDRSGNGEPLKKRTKISHDDRVTADLTGNCIPLDAMTIEIDTHRTGAKCAPGENSDSRLSGAAYHTTGCLRTKPGRGSPSSSHSCSDKLFRWSVLGAQGCLLMAFIESPVYLQSVIASVGPCGVAAMERALDFRYRADVACLNLPTDFKHQKYIISKSDVIFKHSSEEVKARVGKEHAMPCPTSVCWFKSSEAASFQVIVEGRKHGVTKKNLVTKKGQIVLCRAQMFAKVLELYELRCMHWCKGQSSTACRDSLDYVKSLNYRQLKQLSELYCQAWQVLRSSVLVNWTKKPEEYQNFLA